MGKPLVDFKPPQEKIKNKGDKGKTPSLRKSKNSGKKKWDESDAKNDMGEGKLENYPNKKAHQNDGCFICGGPNLTRDYRKKCKVTSMVEQSNDGEPH